MNPISPRPPLLAPVLLCALAIGCESSVKRNAGGAGGDQGAPAEGEGDDGGGLGGDGDKPGEGADGGAGAEGEGDGEGEGEGDAGPGPGDVEPGEGEGEPGLPCGGRCGAGEVCIDGACQFECQQNCDPIDAQCGTCCLGQEGLSHGLGGACGATTRCHPEVVGEEGFQACIEDQCESQLCLNGFCSQRCREDADCARAEDGPVGAVFTCRVTAGAESGICLPGSQFPCATSGDCEEPGESCQLFATGDGHVAGLCVTDYKCGAGPGESCNDDPIQGEVVYCNSGLCNGLGLCIEICENDDQCAYSEGLECGDPVRIYRNLPDMFAVCQGSICVNQEDCPAAMFCGQPDWDAEAEVLSNRCTPENGQGTVGLFSEDVCNLNPDFGPIAACIRGTCEARGFLFERRCTLPCATQEDCPEDFKCEGDWEGVEDDGQRYTRMVMRNVCMYAPGSDALCGGDNDCGEGESCQLGLRVLILDGEGAWQDDAGDPIRDGVDLDVILESRCHPNDEGKALGGEECGEGIADCQNLLCLNSGVCAELCDSSDDCGEGRTCGILQLDPDDAGFAWGFCQDWRGSRTPCPGPAGSCEGLEGAERGEVCLPNVLIEGGVEWFCGTTDGEAELGEDCQNGAECSTGMCVTGVEDQGRVGYCSGGCAADADCPALHSCATEEFYQRGGLDAAPSVTNICKPWLECTTCGDSSHCPVGFACSHMADPDRPDEEVYVGVCLLDCTTPAGEDDPTVCDDTQLAGRVRCRSAEDDKGADIEGKFVCRPNSLAACFPN